MRTSVINNVELVQTKQEDLETLFLFQLNKEENYLAAITAKGPTDKTAYMSKWMKLMTDDTINIKTIWCNGKIAGIVAKYEIEKIPEVTYWIGRSFWGWGIATRALQLLLQKEKARPIYARVAFDNLGSQKVLEKCDFVRIGTTK